MRRICQLPGFSSEFAGSQLRVFRCVEKISELEHSSRKTVFLFLIMLKYDLFEGE